MPIVSFAQATVGIFSFSAITTKPIPHYEFDLTNFRDPMNRKEFKGAVDGTDPKIIEWVKQDGKVNTILNALDLLALDAEKNLSKKWITFAFRDHHGIWKSRAMAEIAAAYLGELGYKVCVFHDEKG